MFKSLAFSIFIYRFFEMDGRERPPFDFALFSVFTIDKASLLYILNEKKRIFFVPLENHSPRRGPKTILDRMEGKRKYITMLKNNNLDDTMLV